MPVMLIAGIFVIYPACVKYGNIILRSVDSVAAVMMFEHRQTKYSEEDADGCAKSKTNRSKIARCFFLWSYGTDLMNRK